MVGSIRPTGVSRIAAVGKSSGAKGTHTSGALKRLAGKVAGRIAREFDLVDDEDAPEDRPDAFREGEDIYDIRDTARELASQLNGRATDEGRLARSLDGFAQESAALLAARPEAASLEAIARTIAVNEQAAERETVDQSLTQIDQTARGIAEGKLR